MNFIAHGFHSNRLHALVVYIAGALSEVGGFSVKGSHFDQERWTKAVSVNGSLFHWGGYQWNVCSVSWYFISFHIHLYTSTVNISIYPCYDIIFYKSSIITGMPFKNTFAFCFKFPNVCFSATRGLEVHVAGLEVPHCRGGVDPASDWTRWSRGVDAFFCVSQRWVSLAVSKKWMNWSFCEIVYMSMCFCHGTIGFCFMHFRVFCSFVACLERSVIGTRTRWLRDSDLARNPIG